MATSELDIHIGIPLSLKEASFKDNGLELDPGKNVEFTLLDAHGDLFGKGQIEFCRASDLSAYRSQLVSPFGELPARVVFEEDGPTLRGLISVAVTFEARTRILSTDLLCFRLTAADQQFISKADQYLTDDPETRYCVFAEWTGADGQSLEPILPEDDAQLQTLKVEFFLQQ